jgi:hypothetical protein
MTTPHLSDHAKELLANREAAREAGALPLPGAAGDAFSTGPIQVGEFSVRKIVAYDWRILQKLNNSLVKQLSAMSVGQSAADSDDDSEWQLIWILTHTLDEVDTALKAGGFESRCRNEIGGLDGGLVSGLCEAVQEQIRRSISTALKYSEKSNEGEKKITRLDTDTPPMVSVGT